MNTILDKNLPITWCAEIINPDQSITKWFDQIRNDGQKEWSILKRFIAENKEYAIKKVHLFSMHNAKSENDFGGAVTKDNAGGYFFAKKAVGNLGMQNTLEIYGIGHLLESEIEIFWYTKDMTCLYNEKRSPEQAEITYIPNNL